MPAISIKITNLAQIRAAFTRAPFLMTKELNVAIGQTVLDVSGESIRRTPVDTGRLRASTYTQVSNLKGEVGTNTYYDRFVHWGTRYMKARPYLKQAIEAKKTSIDNYFTRAVDRALHQIGDKT